MILTYRFRLKDKHAASLTRQARAVNFVWNYCNETQQKAARAQRQWISYFDFTKLTAGSSKELRLLSSTIEGTCKQYCASRQGLKRPWLRFRGRRSLGWVPFKAGAPVVVRDGAVKFNGVVYETMHWRALPEGSVIKTGSFNADAKGRWYISMAVEFDHAAVPHAGPAVAIDLGLKSLVTTSNGDKIDAPRFYRASEAVLAHSQRRRKSKRVRAIHAKIANRRRDFIHKLSNQLTKEYGLIVVGDVSPSKLARTRMAKSVLDAGWSDLKAKLLYKSIRNGGAFLEVSERMTTQTCSSCGATASAERPRGIADLSKRIWRCECGVVHDRDVNAAANILRAGLSTLVAGAAKERSSRSIEKDVTK